MSQPRRASARLENIFVVDPNPTTAKMLANLVRNLSPWIQVYGSRFADQAFALLSQMEPQVIFVEAVGEGFDGMAFVRKLRRSESKCREAPVIMIFGEATASQILEARDSGVHELMRRPFTMGDMQKRLDAVTTGRPRDWIEAVEYIGPDRRRFNSADYKGPRKRRADGPAKTQKMEQALRIVQSAAGAVDSDPVQAARALATQARILIEAAAGQEQYRRLGEAAAVLQTYLQSAASKGLSKDQVEILSANLMRAAPPELRAKAA